MDHILIIDDESQIRRLLDITLSANNFKVTEAINGKEGLLLSASDNPKLILLDLGLPDMDGITVLKKMREWYSGPVIIISVRDSEEDIIEALDCGANDYITKPFRTGELMARIRAVNRQINSSEPVINAGNLKIDLNKHIVTKNGEMLKLTSTEFSLLALFAQNESRVLTHSYILKKIWGVGYTEQPQNLRVFIAQLRKKIEDDPANPKFILTESGIGYRFCFN
jgi:two-component system KDP operon response regulator KdpE